MGAVAVVLDAGLGVLLGERVAAEMVTLLQHEHGLAQHGGDAFGHHRAEEAAAGDDVAELVS